MKRNLDKLIETASQDYANLPPIDFGDKDSIATYASVYDVWFQLTRERDLAEHKGETSKWDTQYRKLKTASNVHTAAAEDKKTNYRNQVAMFAAIQMRKNGIQCILWGKWGIYAGLLVDKI